MRKQIAAANWKMNLTYQQAEKLLDEILDSGISMQEHQYSIFAVPFPYLLLTRSEVDEEKNFAVAAQNCHHKKTGAFTGEVSAPMLHSMNIRYCIIGHSERREYNAETNVMLSEKINLCLEYRITPLFCCGESLPVREEGRQNEFVEEQLKESLFHLSAEQVAGLIIAYEPIWAIGTGKTATAAQAQEMHSHIRSVLAAKYGAETAGQVPILYGGSVKADNAKEIFSGSDVDGGLVGGASLVASDFASIIKALK